MGLFSRNSHRPLRKDSKRTDQSVSLSEFGAIDLDESMVQGLRDDLPDPQDRPAIRVRPFKDNDGIESGVDFLESVYDVERGGFRGRKNTSPAHAFEIRYTGERVNFQFVPDADWTGTFERQLKDKYPNALIEQAPAETLSFDSDKHVAGAELDLALYTLYPIEHVGLEGWRRDPFGGITSEMVGYQKDGEASADVLVQVVFRPESRDWVHGVNGGPDVDEIAHNLNQPTIKRERRLFTKTKVEYPPSDIEKKAAKIVRDQHGKRAWNVNIRVFAVSEDERVARRRVKKAATQFENYYECATEQMFVPEPLSGRDLRDGLDRLVNREWTDRGIVKSEQEVGGFVHIPNAEINQQNVEWALSRPGEGIPPGTPRFDFDDAGVAMGSQKEKQLAMLDSSGPGDPFWFGWGAKNGIEAGIYEHTLNAHMFVGGGTRKGKSTLLTNFTSQVMERDYGGLVITLGKDDDDEEFIAEWPEDRPEDDFVFIDTGDDYEEMVRFNLLEVPEELEPGSVAHSSYVESLADDMSAAFAQTGGSDNYWGALMSRVTRTLIRGMTMSGKTCTPVDLAAACSSQDNLEQFADWMDEERIHFIRETAERIKEKEDSDLEPLAGRMDNVVHNATLRTLLSTREPTVRIHDIVDDGKIAVLRLDPSLGETEKNFITTPLVRRFYNAKKMSENDDPFFCVWDEFDKAVTPESNVDEMLSEAGGYGLWFVLACQAPSYQLPEQLTNAVESQIETFISFGTSGKDAKYIAGQHTVDDDDLSNLSRYTMYMRTHDDNDDFTHSYRVNTFPPVREVRSEVGDGQLMTDDEIAEFKRKSVERYGDIPETPEEIKSESHFFAGELEDDEDDESASLTPWQQSRVCKAVYDEAIRQDVDDGFVFLNDVVDRLDQYLHEVDVSTPAKVSAALDNLSEREIEREDRDGKIYVRCTAAGKQAIFSAGSSLSPGEKVQENEGGEGHKQLLRDAYEPLMDTGLLVDIPQQDGSDMPDAIATLDDVDELQIDSGASPREIANQVEQFETERPLLAHLTDLETVAIEAEKSTGRTKPGQTIRNLANAIEDGRRCLFVAREKTARKIERTLTAAETPLTRPHDVENETRFYHNPHYLRIDGHPMYREGDARETIWVRDETTGEIVLRDSDGTEHARFPSVDAVFTDTSAYANPDDPDVDETTRVKAPVIPERLLPEGTRPDEAVRKCDIIALPQGSDPEGRLSTVLDGDLYPLEALIDDDVDDRDRELEDDDGDDDRDQGSDLDDLASTLENV